MKFSFKNKIFLVFMVMILISAGIIGWYGFDSAKKAYTKSTLQDINDKVEILNNRINGVLHNIPKDVLFNSNIHSLQRYIIWSSLKEKDKINYWKDIYISNASDFLRNLKLFHQMRILDIRGKEKMRLIYDIVNDVIKQVPKDRLQDKSKRLYFKESIKLKKGQFYISKMDLNKENGIIERPFVPVVRYATPIVDKNDDTKSILVMNLRADIILDIIDKQNRIDKNIDFFLINKDGYYLYNKDKDKRWGEDLKTKYSFNEDYPGVMEQFVKNDSSNFVYNGKIYSVSKIYPNKKYYSDRYWYLVGVEDTKVAFASLSNFIRNYALIVVFILLLVFFVTSRFIKIFTDPIQKVNKQLRLLSKGIIAKDESIRYSFNDEIGEIVKSSSILLDSMNGIIEQSKAVANGDFTKDFELLSEEDELGKSVLEMKRRLSEITEIASKISLGNYNVEVNMLSSKDVLGKALLNMIEYLKEVSKVAESIAQGRLNVEYKSKGRDDRLSIALLKMIKYLKNILKQSKAIAVEDFSKNIVVKSKEDELGMAISKMTQILRESSIKNREEMWFRSGVSEFTDRITGTSDIVQLSKDAITFICRYIEASSGVVYIVNEDDNTRLKLFSTFSYSKRNHLLNEVKIGEGVIGQVALEKEAIHLTNIEEGSYLIESGTILASAKEVYTFPLVHDGELFGVAEVMSFEEIDRLKVDFIRRVSDIFATVLHTTYQNLKIQKLLEESQKAYEELQAQSEELQETNIQMEEQQQQLELQAKEMRIKNETLLKVQEELNKRAKELETANKYKNEFLANMSHELRTPLNSIILLSKLLSEETDCTKDEIEKVKVINKAGNDLLLLINDILDLSKIESGRMELDEIDTNSQDIVEELRGLFGELAKTKGLEFKISDNINGAILVDKTKLLQILKNLLSNAFKFTESGSVEVALSRVENKIEIVVKDTGIGIPDDKKELIFEAFRQVDGSVSRKYGGTGLGLSISKTFAKLMGGEIRLESEVGVGTTFTVILPYKEGRDMVESVAVESKTKSVVESDIDIKDVENIEDEDESNLFLGKNILIADDDSRNIFTISSLLQKYGAEVLTALDGKEALEVLDGEERVDAVLVDIMMPEVDGIEFIKKIREKSRYKDIPLIVVSAKSMQEDKRVALEAGANEFTSKPIDKDSIIKLLKAWILN